MGYGTFHSQIEELRAFITIVETGSLTQASDRMGVAVSAVSRRLRDLELRLGIVDPAIDPTLIFE